MNHFLPRKFLNCNFWSDPLPQMTLEKTLMKHEFCFEVAVYDVKTDVTTSLPASQVFTESYLALSVYGSAYSPHDKKDL